MAGYEVNMEAAKRRNSIVKEIETAYRKEKDSSHATEGRLRFINPGEARRIMMQNEIGIQCEKCLNKNGGRYCSHAHSNYYRGITNSLYGQNYPFSVIELRKKDVETKGRNNEYQKIRCPSCGKELPWIDMSVDHINPISKGGLEFDRENLQWMCLPCNLKKHNHLEDNKQTRLNQ